MTPIECTIRSAVNQAFQELSMEQVRELVMGPYLEIRERLAGSE